MAEGVHACAGELGGGVLERELGALEAVLVVERGALQEVCARGVDDHPHTAFVSELVVVGDVGVEEHLVAEARAAAGADGDPERELGGALGLDEVLDLGGCGLCERDHVVGPPAGSYRLEPMLSGGERELDMARRADGERVGGDAGAGAAGVVEHTYETAST